MSLCRYVEVEKGGLAMSIHILWPFGLFYGHILWPFGLFYGHILGPFGIHILWLFGIFFPVLVRCTKKIWQPCVRPMHWTKKRGTKNKYKYYYQMPEPHFDL
jgi:hypothetical protein